MIKQCTLDLTPMDPVMITLAVEAAVVEGVVHVIETQAGDARIVTKDAYPIARLQIGLVIRGIVKRTTKQILYSHKEMFIVEFKHLSYDGRVYIKYIQLPDLAAILLINDNATTF